MREMRSVPHQTLRVTIEQCGPEDLEPMLDRLETLLHEDYFFRRKHFAAILARPNAAVYAIRVDFDFAAIAIVYNGSTLQNLYVHPEHRRQGVGQAVLQYLNPDVVRAKGNMSQGNPVPFYEGAGYRAVGADAARPHIVLMEREAGTAALNKVQDEHPVPPSPPGPVAVKAPISDAKKEHLNRIREKSIANRKAKKQQADFDRLVAAGIEPDKARAFAFGPSPAAASLGEATIGTLPD